MIARRHLLGIPFVGGLIAPTGAAGTAEPAEFTDRHAQEIAAAISGLRAAIENQRSFTEIDGVRRRQTDHLRTVGKLPDYIEVGTSVWWAIHDWHVRHLQPFQIGRDAMGRYTIGLTQTLVILRTDMAPGEIGLPYDNR